MDRRGWAGVSPAHVCGERCRWNSVPSPWTERCLGETRQPRPLAARRHDFNFAYRYEEELGNGHRSSRDYCGKLLAALLSVAQSGRGYRRASGLGLEDARARGHPVRWEKCSSNLEDDGTHGRAPCDAVVRIVRPAR
ncbi:hypothetical protein HPB50_016359 [Hyalomma asiaticum]|uniref:Uncharacterized protein n=1 Tax=Hyalomma asiaticum TaxID=266040 RepID=A0ACB7SR05_HYAAI|nr:hypothetical protein HPB50_016359 [Hyalomma asiaticum]